MPIFGAGRGSHARHSLRALGVTVVTLGCVLAFVGQNASVASAAGATSETSDPATNVLGGPGHNAYTATSLGGPLHQLWQRQLPGDASWALESGGRAFVEADDTLYALSAADGSVLWAIDLGGGAGVRYDPAAMAVDGDTLITSDRHDGALVGYDVATGKARWTVPAVVSGSIRGYLDLVSPGGGVFYVESNVDTTLQARSTATGRLLWSTPSPGHDLAYSDGVLYASTSQPGCGVAALDPTTGSQLWRRNGDCTTFALPENYLVVADGDAYDTYGDVTTTANGTPNGAWSGDQPPVRAGGQLLTVTGHTLTSTDAGDGSSEWTFDAQGTVAGTPYVAGTTAYVGTTDGRLDELDLATGHVEDTHQLRHGYSATAYLGQRSMSVADGLLLVPNGDTLTAFTHSGYVGARPSAVKPVAVHWPSGARPHDVTQYLGNAQHDNATAAASVGSSPRLVWRQQLTEAPSAPLITAHRVIVTTGPQPKSEVLAFDRRTGRPVWHVEMPKPLSGSAVVRGNTVYVQTGAGRLLGIALHSGHVRFDRRLPTDYHNTWGWDAPLTVAGKSLYVVGSGDGERVYSLSLLGRKQWVSGVDSGDLGAVAVAGSRVLYDGPCQNWALDATDGLPLWTTDLGCSGGGGLTTVTHAGVVYDADPGSVNHESLTKNGLVGASFSSDREPVVQGSLMFTISRGRLMAEDTATHRIRWFRDDGFALPPLVVGKRVYDVTDDGSVVQLSALTGHQTWRRAGDVATSGFFDAYRDPTAPEAAHGTLVVPEGDQLLAFAR